MNSRQALAETNSGQSCFFTVRECKRRANCFPREMHVLSSNSLIFGVAGFSFREEEQAAKQQDFDCDEALLSFTRQKSLPADDERHCRRGSHRLAKDLFPA